MQQRYKIFGKLILVGKKTTLEYHPIQPKSLSSKEWRGQNEIGMSSFSVFKQLVEDIKSDSDPIPELKVALYQLEIGKFPLTC